MKPRIFNPFRSSIKAFISVLTLGCFAAPSAFAGERYWDPLAAVGFGTVTGTDIWAPGLDKIWTTADTGNLVRLATYTTTFADNCYFGGPVEFLGGGTIPVDAGGVDAGTLTFNNVTGSILLSGGPITLKAAAIITANNTNTHTINSVIAGAATSLTKAGTGTVVLSGVNTYAGPTQIDGGILVFGNTSAKASGLVTAAATGAIGLGVGGAGGYAATDVVALFNTGILTGFSPDPASGVAVDTTNGNLDITADLTGSRSLTKVGSGALTLSGTNNTYTGATNINTGTLILNHANALGGNNPGVNGTSGITMADATTLRTPITNGGVTVYAPITTAGNVTINGPTTNTGTQTWNEFIVNGAIGGTGNVTFNNTVNSNTIFTVTLGAQSNYSGTTTIDNTAGTAGQMFVKLGINNALPTTTVLNLLGGLGAGTGAGRAVELNLFGFNQTLAGLTNTTFTARSQRVVNSDASAAATLTINGSTNTTFSGNLGSNAKNFSLNTAAIPGSTNGNNFGLTKSGSGVFTLGGVNTYAGATTISGGTLEIGHLSALGNTPGITIGDGATLRPTIVGLTLSVPITLGAAGTNATINAPATATTSPGGTIETLNLNSVISGAGDLTLNGSNGFNIYGTIVLGVASNYLGATRIDCSNGGATCFVKNGVADALPVTTVLTLDGGPGAGSGRFLRYDLNGFNQTLAGLKNATGIVGRKQEVDNTGAAATLTVNNADDYTFGVSPGTSSYATIQGAISLLKSGVGIFTLHNSHTYTGTTTVSAGTLKLGTSNVLPSTAVSIGAGTLDVGAGFTDTVGTLDCTGAAVINLGTGASLVFADSNLIGGTGVWAGTLNITGDFTNTSIKFATSGGLTAGQLAKISVNSAGLGTYTLDGSGYLVAGASSGFDTWKTVNGATGQTLGDDHDNDGVSNGVEYFIYGPVANSGFTALPSVTNTAGTLSVTWTHPAGYTGTYGPGGYEVEVSSTLGSWVPAVLGAGPNEVDITTVPGDVKYTFPAGTKNFARLKVTGP